MLKFFYCTAAQTSLWHQAFPAENEEDAKILMQAFVDAQPVDMNSAITTIAVEIRPEDYK